MTEKIMDQFKLTGNGETADFLIEAEGFEGIRILAQTVADDVALVTETRPGICSDPSGCGGHVVLMATCEKSSLLECLAGKLPLSSLREKRESYLMQILEDPFPEHPGIHKLLVIAGSDKRGTIYGMFRLSEMCGVSPLVFFGDVIPVKRRELVFSLPGPVISKEPSVMYRGFFINDEWPAFGNWCTEKYGGINTDAYRKIFELLLRLKGNYLWPAMWNSSFSEDGPGLECAWLADTLGIIMGTSHHEPMCRAGVEWQNQYRHYGDDSDWSFVSNADAITRFWDDGIKRNKSFENVITIGMRGENDSKLMPADATLQDNIDLIRKAILAQHTILRKHFGSDLAKVPRMLAIYKEVEDYYFGDENCPGLKDWDELSDVIFLLSDDNYGNLRAVPTKEEMDVHPGGYGMYYHFDYHGSPISYEWVNCNRLTRTWEQMTLAYEAGIRKMWIVNVGDLKGVEYPLCYFMDLAYDFERLGSSALNSTEQYVREWIDRQFPGDVTAEQKEKIFTVLEGYTRWNAARSPESMRKGIFHPVHFRESDRVAREIGQIMETAKQLDRKLPEEALSAWRSMIFYPAMASLNLIMMYLEAGYNQYLAERGCLYANIYAGKVRHRIQEDQELVGAFHRILDGKWNHMMRSSHTGFRSWDDRDWTYPTVETVNPIHGGKVVIGFRGSDQYHLGAHWQDKEPLDNDDLMVPGMSEVIVDIDSRGDVSFTYRVLFDAPWLCCDQDSGRVDTQKDAHACVTFRADKHRIIGCEEAHVSVQIEFDNGQTTHSRLLIRAEQDKPATKEIREALNGDVQEVFLERQGICCIRASHFSQAHDVDGAGFRTVSRLGREGDAIKVFPVLRTFSLSEDAPSVKYDMAAAESGTYQLFVFVLARNPLRRGGRLRFAVSANGGEKREVCSVGEHYYTEWFDPEWAAGALDHARVAVTDLSLQKGLNEICLYAMDPGLILEKLVLVSEGKNLPESYFGPEESASVNPDGEMSVRAGSC